MGRVFFIWLWPVEQESFSKGKTNENETKIHPPCGCATFVIQKNHLSDYNKIVQVILQKGKVIYGEAIKFARTHKMNVQISYRLYRLLTPKDRRKIIYNQYKADIRDILKQLCGYKGEEILEGRLMPDHIHMPVNLPLKISVSSLMGYFIRKKRNKDVG